MSDIMTRRGWRQLDPAYNIHSEVEMQVWERVSYDFHAKQYVPDASGPLRLVDFVDTIPFTHK